MNDMHLFIYTDGGARGNPGPAGAGVYITNSQGIFLKGVKKSLGTTTNNEAEYEAVLLGLLEAKKLIRKEERKNAKITVCADSELVVKQLNGEYQVKEARLFPYFMKVWNTKVSDFPNISFEYIPREKNKEADRLANEAMDSAQEKLF